MKRKHQKEKNQTKSSAAKPEETIAGNVLIALEAITRAVNKARGLPVEEAQYSGCVPGWYHNIADILVKTVFKGLLALDSKGQFDARNFGRTTGMILRGTVFFGKEFETMLKTGKLWDLSEDQEKKLDAVSGIEVLFGFASKKFNRPIRNENQLVNQGFRHLEKWAINLLKGFKGQFVQLWNLPIEEQHKFLCGIAEGFILFLDSEGQFAGDRGRTTLYLNLIKFWPEIAAMQKAEPSKSRRDLQTWLINEAKIPISDNEEWFDHLCDEIGLSMKRAGRPGSPKQ
jgi:hypothetical protein